MLVCPFNKRTMLWICPAPSWRKLRAQVTLMSIRQTLLVLTLCAGAPPGIGAPAGPVPAKSMALLFDRGDAVWIANGQGTDQRLLILNAHAPVWSPDHKRIAFARGGEVWVCNRDASHQRQLTRWWMALGKHIQREIPEVQMAWDPVEPVLTVSREETYEVVRGKQRTKVTGSVLYDVPLVPGPSRKIVQRFGPEEEGAGYQFSNQECPAWSRDGKWLAFARNGDVWVTHRQKPDPGDFHQFDRDTFRLVAPARFDDPDYRGSRENEGVKRLSWSPDGRHLAYCFERLGGSGTYSSTVLTIGRGADGSPRGLGRKAIPGLAAQPCFSPDGKWIAFGSWSRNGACCPDIWVATLDGRVRRRLITNASEPAW